MGLIKTSAERNLTKKIKVVGESSMHTLKSTGREGVGGASRYVDLNVQPTKLEIRSAT